MEITEEYNMTLFEAISGRYSFRGEFKKNGVPRSDLQKILEAGLAAPSGCNAQTAYLIGVDDPALITEGAGILGKNSLADAPAAVCVVTRAIPSYRDMCFNVQDYSAAIENILLAITALGYVSCWYEGVITSDSKRQKAFSALLKIPDEYDVVAWLPFGVPAAPGRRAAHLPFGERAFFNGFKTV